MEKHCFFCGKTSKKLYFIEYTDIWGDIGYVFVCRACLLERGGILDLS